MAMATHVSNPTTGSLERRFSRAGIFAARAHRWAGGLASLVAVRFAGTTKRAVDILGAMVLLLLGSPLLLTAAVAARRQHRPMFNRTVKLGLGCVRFQELSLVLPDTRRGRILQHLGARRLPALFNILRGDLSFVGPRAVCPGQPWAPVLAWRRYEVRPGLLNPWWLRQRANIGYGTETQSDWDYLEDWSVMGDVGLALRAIPALLYGRPASNTSSEVEICGIRVDNLAMDEAVARIAGLCSGTRPTQVSFVNADCANIAWRDLEYRATLRRSGLCLADGIGMKLAGRLLRNDIRQNVNGTDLFPRLCAALAGTPHGLFLLGGRPGVPESVADWIRVHHPGVRVCGLRHGYFEAGDEARVLAEINASGASIVLVAMGVPRQEKWIQRHLDGMEVRVAMGVGGLFDFYSGRIPRAPQWLREMGLEWLFRFYQEPRRMWRRYFVGNFVFLRHVMAMRLKGNAARGEMPEAAEVSS